MSHPSAMKRHASLAEWLTEETQATGYWANTPKFMVSYLKSVYGDAATPENDFGYDWHPKIIGDHSHLPMFVAMNERRVKGMLCVGQNPATSLNAKLERAGLRKLEWLVVKDNWLHETANFWKSPAISRPRCSSFRRPRWRSTTAASPTPSACCSGTTRRSSRRATAAPTSGSPGSSACG
jgi:formate dehydrogenase major subunit